MCGGAVAPSFPPSLCLLPAPRPPAPHVLCLLARTLAALHEAPVSQSAFPPAADAPLGVVWLVLQFVSAWSGGQRASWSSAVCLGRGPCSPWRRGSDRLSLLLNLFFASSCGPRPPWQILWPQLQQLLALWSVGFLPRQPVGSSLCVWKGSAPEQLKAPAGKSLLMRLGSSLEHELQRWGTDVKDNLFGGGAAPLCFWATDGCGRPPRCPLPPWSEPISPAHPGLAICLPMEGRKEGPLGLSWRGFCALLPLRPLGGREGAAGWLSRS